MKQIKPRSSAFKKFLAVFLVAALVIAAVSAGALAAGAAQQPSTNQQQIQPYSGQQNQHSSTNQQDSMGMMGRGNSGQGQQMFGFNSPMKTGVRGLAVVGIAIALLVCLVCDVLLTLYVYLDAKRIGHHAVLWAILVFFTTVLGLLIYLLYKQRKEHPEVWRAAPKPAPGRVCPNCRSVQSPENAYCYVCGAPMELRCKKCGAPLHPKAVFCPVCGVKAGEGNVPAPEPVTGSETVPATAAAGPIATEAEQAVASAEAEPPKA
ncbi:MAG: zinc ribbon domain-containing protein [Firmicutes bacterium]|nr:zinc ribbon domain-containing protein [Bacillota bacterium]